MFIRKRNQNERVKHVFLKRKEDTVEIVKTEPAVIETPKTAKKPASGKRKAKKEEIQETVVPIEETVENNEIENTEENGTN
jgi:hypothetical protein